MASRYSDNAPGSQRRGRKKGPNWKKAFIITLSIVLAVVVAGGAGVYYYGHKLIGLTKYVSGSEELLQGVQSSLQNGSGTVQGVSQDGSAQPQGTAAEAVSDVNNQAPQNNGAAAAKPAEEPLLEVETEPETDAYHIGVKVGKDELNEIQQKMDSFSNSIATVADDDVFNLLLVGVDRRDKSWNGNSDSMMLVSVNFKAGRVSVISLMRDTYVNIPGVGYAKLNNAYARGGGELLCQTITDTYKVDLSRYAAVDFENMIEIIDALGGIDLEMTDAEVQVANGYMVDMCNTLGLDPGNYVLPGGGVWHVGGVQAVAYARNRFVGNSDYARTERQRYVISQILQEIKRMNVIQLTQFATDVLPLITHNVKEKEIWDLVTKAPDVLGYKFVQDRVPYDGMYDVIYVNGQDMLVPYWEDTIRKMHDTIYGEGTISQNSDNQQEDRSQNNDEFIQEYQDMVAAAEAAAKAAEEAALAEQDAQAEQGAQAAG